MVLLAVISIFLISAPAFSAVYDATISTPGVIWAGSAYRARSALKNEEGVSNVIADQEKHEVTLTFDSDVITEEDIRKKLEGAGFSVQEMKIVEAPKK